ncbi:MAG TPA: hypothetical protein VF326_14100, partial [Anaerolineaceae bacterium]
TQPIDSDLALCYNQLTTDSVVAASITGDGVGPPEMPIEKCRLSYPPILCLSGKNTTSLNQLKMPSA